MLSLTLYPALRARSQMELWKFLAVNMDAAVGTVVLRANPLPCALASHMGASSYPDYFTFDCAMA